MGWSSYNAVLAVRAPVLGRVNFRYRRVDPIPLRYRRVDPNPLRYRRVNPIPLRYRRVDPNPLRYRRVNPDLKHGTVCVCVVNGLGNGMIGLTLTPRQPSASRVTRCSVPRVGLLSHLDRKGNESILCLF